MSKAKLIAIFDWLLRPLRKRSSKMSRYIFKQALVVFLMFALSLTCIIWLSQSLRFIDMIVNRGLSVGVFITFAGLLIPSLLHLIIPLAMFFGILFTYNKLTLDHEITILRAAGQSPKQLAKPAVVLALIGCMVSLFISVYGMPASYRAFKDLQNTIRDNYSATLLQEGVFTEVTKGVTVFIREREGTGDLTGILVHDSRIPDQKITIIANNGQLVRTDTGPSVLVKNGIRQELSPETGRMSTLYFDEYTVDLTTLSGEPMLRWREPRERFIPELVFLTDNIDDQRNKQEMQAELHQRLLTPIYNFTFAFVALVVMLFGEYPRKGQGQRILIAVSLLIILQAFSLISQSIAATTPLGVPFMYISCLVPLFIAARLVLSSNSKDFARQLTQLIKRLKILLFIRPHTKAID